MFKVKITGIDKSISWITCGNKFSFTKSKCEFLISCSVKNNYFPGCSFEIVG